MLRAEFRFPVERWPQRLFAWLLGEPVLGFLAIIAVALTLFPMLFDVGSRASAGIDLLQWTIIGWFGFEYLFALASAENRLAFLRNPWRLLDLATVVLPVATLLPSVSNALRSSPVLRLVRLGRLVTLGVRVSGITVRRHSHEEEQNAAVGPTEIKRFAPGAGGKPIPAMPDEVAPWLRAPGDEWYHVASPDPGELTAWTTALELPSGFLDAHLFGTNYAHAATTSDRAALFLRVPEVDKAGHVDRRGVLLVPLERGVLSLSRRSTPGVARLARLAGAPSHDGQPFGLRVVTVALEELVRENENLAAKFEQELHALEDLPVRESKPVFFERTFRLKKELSAAQADLWRLKGILADLAERRIRLPGETDTHLEAFSRMRAGGDYLYDTIVNLREELLSLIDLHLNVVSFEMNRVMRVLAVVSVLGLIPAVIGGLFGMNLVDNPWPFTLPQVAFSIVFGMVLCLYLFFVKGWLR